MLIKKNIKIGENNFISDKAIIHDNVIIGNNNNIYDNVVIHQNTEIGNNNNIHDNVIILQNTEIGNNNNIFKGNIIGEFPVNTDEKFKNYDLSKSKGVKIGNNNLFHINNIIFGGINNKTQIGNNNKFLSENHINHDVIIKNNVTFYIRVVIAGFSICLDYCNIGSCAFIQQKTVIGQYTMIGAQSALTKNAFPYFVNINNKITRLNHIKISKIISENEIILREINDKIIKKEDINELLNKLPTSIKNELEEYIFNINNFKFY